MEKKRPTSRRRGMQLMTHDQIAGLKRDLWDAGLGGFGIRVSKNARAWVVMYRHAGKLGRLTIGNALAMPYSEARAKAVEVHKKAAAGEDPKAAAPKPAAGTVREAFNRYLEQVGPDLRPATALGKRQRFARDVLPHIGDRPISVGSPGTELEFAL